jgi:hypothetical protein
MDHAKKGCHATELTPRIINLGAKCGQMSSFNVRMLYDRGRLPGNLVTIEYKALLVSELSA